jgi:hypothetical protein
MTEPEDHKDSHQENEQENWREQQPEYDPEQKSDFPAAFLAGAVIVLLLFGGLMALVHFAKPRGPAPNEKIPFGAAEQAYAEHIHFSNIQMARAKNMLDQEFTYIAGTMSNDGTRTVQGLDVTIEFRDPFNQVILRDPERIIGSGTGPVDAGLTRDFQITLEHIPAEWNQQYPVIRVTGLLLE